MKLNSFTAQPTQVALSAWRRIWTQTDSHHTTEVAPSASCFAEISVMSPWKLFIFIILKKYFLDQSIKKIYYLILKTEALVAPTAWGVLTSADLLAEVSLRSPRKPFISIIWEIHFWDQSIQKNIKFHFEKNFTGSIVALEQHYAGSSLRVMQCFCFRILIKYFLDTLIQKIIF